MNKQEVTFDQVFRTWLDNELEAMDGRDMLALANTKGFNSISEWRLSTALRLGLDTKEWTQTKIENPGEVLPKVIIGPYQGWSIHFDNQFNTSFESAMEIAKFFEWCKDHNRIPKIAENFPLPSTIILLQKTNGDLIHIEGGHRMCAVAYAKKIGKPIQFMGKAAVIAMIAQITDEEILNLQNFLKQGTGKLN